MKLPETLSAKAQVWFTEKRSATFRVPVARMRLGPVRRSADGSGTLDVQITTLPWMRVMVVALRVLRVLRLCRHVEVSAP